MNFRLDGIKKCWSDEDKNRRDCITVDTKATQD